nr:hypothetical protein [Candidatus Njordarchaeum guaymaensis]
METRIGHPLEADPRIRQDRKMQDAETTGLSLLRMSINPLKPVNKAYLSKKLKDA